VVSVHLSAALSGTVAAASIAAAHAAVPVTVLDGRNTAMGLGFAVLAAARCAANGATACSVMEAATDAIARTRTFLYVDTLEHLRRGGRIGAAGALLGTALSVKPILHVVDGEIALLDRCRTATRAIARLTELVVAEAGDGPVDLAVHHLGTPGRARQLASQLAERLPALRDLYLSEVGAVVGAHAGPGLLGAVVHRRR
jgi:DegV family protein with EDD domain